MWRLRGTRTTPSCPLARARVVFEVVSSVAEEDGPNIGLIILPERGPGGSDGAAAVSPHSQIMRSGLAFLTVKTIKMVEAERSQQIYIENQEQNP